MNANLKLTAVIASLTVVAFFIICIVFNFGRNSKDMDKECIQKTQKVRFKLHRLEINNKWFLRDLEEIVFSEKIPSLREGEYKYFHICAQQDEDSTYLIVQLTRNAFPAHFGYFELNGYVFFVWGDLNPDNIFIQTQEIRKFHTIRYISGSPPPPEEFPIWSIKYETGRLHLLEKYIW